MLQIGKYICANCIFPNWKIYLRKLYFSKLQYIYLHGLYFSKLQNIFAWVVFFQMQNTFAWTVFFQFRNIFAWIIFFQMQNTFARTVFFQFQNIHISMFIRMELRMYHVPTAHSEVSLSYQSATSFNTKSAKRPTSNSQVCLFAQSTGFDLESWKYFSNPPSCPDFFPVLWQQKARGSAASNSFPRDQNFASCRQRQKGR